MGVEVGSPMLQGAQRAGQRVANHTQPVFVWFAHVQDLNSRRGVAERVLHVQDTHLVGVREGSAAFGLSFASGFDGFQSCDSGRGPADRAMGVGSDVQFAEPCGQGVNDHQAPDERLADAEDEFECFRGLERADQPGQDTEDPRFGAVGHRARRRRFGEEATVTRTSGVRREHTGLPFEAQDRAVDVGFLQEHAGVVHQIAGDEVIRAVDHPVIATDEFEGVPAVEAGGVNLHVDVGIQRFQRGFGGPGLGFSHAVGAVEDLAMQVGDVECVKFHEAQASHAGGGEVEEGGGAQSSGSHAQDAGGSEFLLSVPPQLRENDLPRVALDFFEAQAHQAAITVLEDNRGIDAAASGSFAGGSNRSRRTASSTDGVRFGLRTSHRPVRWHTNNGTSMKLDIAFVLDQAGWPAFLVDESGMIRRANRAAVTALGRVMEGESSLSASIWSPQNPMTAEEFLSRLERSSLFETQLQFKVKGGGSSPFTTYVCPFLREGKKLRLFQLLPPQAPSDVSAQPGAVKSATAAVGAETGIPPADIEFGTAQKQKLDCALQLIRTVALDFNNALTTILGHSSLLLSRAEPGHPWRKSLIQVERSAEKAAEIAQDLAEFSRQEKDPNSQAPGNLNEVLRHAVEAFQGPGYADILWTLQLEKRLYTVNFDEAKLQQAFVKVLENAVEAIEARGRVEVRTLNHSFSEPVASPSLRLAAGHYVCIEIADNGCGIDPEIQSRLFEPFFTTKKDPKHRGLGLAWVYGIVTNHGGIVSVTSSSGGGTLVRIFLPAQQKIVRDQGTKLDDLRGHETVLVVDDEEMLLNLGQTVLSAFGYTVLTANGGEQALELFQEQASRIQLVITDLVMPGMSGRELVDRLRRLAPKIPILRTSGYVRQSGEGEDETYLRKPFTSQELLRRVRHLLNHPSAGRG